MTHITTAGLRRLQRNAADPEKAHKRRKPPVLRERDVQRAITDYLTVELGPEGVGWFRMNAGEAEAVQALDNAGDAPSRRIRLAPAGTTDLLAIIPVGRFFRCSTGGSLFRSSTGWYAWVAVPLFIEVKAPGAKTERLRARQQLAFGEEMRARGCLAIEARSLDDVIAALPARRAR